MDKLRAFLVLRLLAGLLILDDTLVRVCYLLIGRGMIAAAGAVVLGFALLRFAFANKLIVSNHLANNLLGTAFDLVVKFAHAKLRSLWRLERTREGMFPFNGRSTLMEEPCWRRVDNPSIGGREDKQSPTSRGSAAWACIGDFTGACVPPAYDYQAVAGRILGDLFEVSRIRAFPAG